MTVHIAKVHDVLNGATTHGTTVLVDRLWPRGVSKEKLQPDHWLQDVAPSSELRQWFNHDPEKFEECSLRYRAELDDRDAEDLEKLQGEVARVDVTLLYGAADRKHNHAVVLMEWLNETPLPK